jgi:hypothetical protein
VIVGLPTAESLYETEHEPDERAHWPLEGVNAPVPLDDVKVTVPVGVLPVTVALQVVDDPVETVEGEQETDVVVDVSGTGAREMPTSNHPCNAEVRDAGKFDGDATPDVAYSAKKSELRT